MAVAPNEPTGERYKEQDNIKNEEQGNLIKCFARYVWAGTMAVDSLCFSGADRQKKNGEKHTGEHEQENVATHGFPDSPYWMSILAPPESAMRPSQKRPMNKTGNVRPATIICVVVSKPFMSPVDSALANTISLMSFM